MRKVVLVDDNEMVLNAFGEFLELAAGVQCLRFHGLSELVERENEVCSSAVALAVLDINLGHAQPSGIDVYRWLLDRHFSGKIAFLTAHAEDHPLVREASLIGGVKVFAKPMGAEMILSLIEDPHDSSESSHA